MVTKLLRKIRNNLEEAAKAAEEGGDMNPQSHRAIKGY